MPNGKLDLVIGDDGLSATVRDDTVVDAFYTDVAPELAAWAKSKLRSQALAPWMTPVATTNGRFGSVPRHYIECLRDRTIPIETQRAMATALPCRSIEQLDTGHSPFLSTPARLVATLLRVAVRSEQKGS